MSICYFLLRLEKVQNISQNGFPKTRVRIKKQSKSNELGAPALNSISNYTYTIFNIKMSGKSGNIVKKSQNVIFGNSSQNRKALYIDIACSTLNSK